MGLFPLLLVFQVFFVAIGLALPPQNRTVAIKEDPVVADADGKIVEATTSISEFPTTVEAELELGFRRLFFDEESDDDLEVDIDDGVTLTLQRPSTVDIEEAPGTNGSSITNPNPVDETKLMEQKPPQQSPSSNKETVNFPVETNDGPNAVRKVTDLTEDLLEWEAPIWYQKYCPYYHAGFDDYGQPVWIAELGKYPVKELGELSVEGYREFDKYVKQLSLRVIKSIEAQNAVDDEVTKASFIIDLDGLDIIQLGSTRTIAFLLRIFAAYKDLITNYMDSCFAVNVNYLTGAVINVIKPVLGNAFDKVEFFGTNAAKLKYVLQKRLPKNALPPWYGGYENFKPIKVYG